MRRISIFLFDTVRDKEVWGHFEILGRIWILISDSKHWLIRLLLTLRRTAPMTFVPREALELNLKAAGVEDRCTVLQGDNR